MTPSRKGKKKILEKYESKLEWEEDVDATIKQTISKVAKTVQARSNLRDLIASITVKKPTAAKPTPATTQQTPTKSSVTAPNVFSKRKRGTNL